MLPPPNRSPRSASLERAPAPVLVWSPIVPEEGEARIEVGLGDADPVALRHAQELGRADVGTAPQQLGGDADRDLRGRRWGSPWSPPAAPRPYPAAAPAGWPGRSCACTRLISSWGIVARVLSSSVVAWCTSSSEVAPWRKRASAIRSPSSCSATLARACSRSDLEGADHGVGARDLGGERDQGGVVVGHGRQVLRGPRLHVAPVPAPEVELPGGVEPELVVPEVAVERSRCWRACSLRPTAVALAKAAWICGYCRPTATASCARAS